MSYSGYLFLSFFRYKRFFVRPFDFFSKLNLTGLEAKGDHLNHGERPFRKMFEIFFDRLKRFSYDIADYVIFLIFSTPFVLN